MNSLIACAIYLLIDTCFSQCDGNDGYKCLTFSGLNGGSVNVNGEWQSTGQCVNTVNTYTSTSHPGVYICHYSSGQNWIFTDTICDNSAGHILARCWRARHNIDFCYSGDWSVFDASGVETSLTGVNVVGSATDCGVTGDPTKRPSPQPTSNPIIPSNSPTRHPTLTPSHHPSGDPTYDPSFNPSVLPTNTPTWAEGEAHDEETTQDRDDDGEYTTPQDEPEMSTVQTLVMALGGVLLCLFILCCGLCVYMFLSRMRKNEADDDGENLETDPNTATVVKGEMYTEEAEIDGAQATEPQVTDYHVAPAPVSPVYNPNMVMYNQGQYNIQSIGSEEANNNDMDDGPGPGMDNQPILGTPGILNDEQDNIGDAAQGNVSDVNKNKCMDCGEVKDGKIFPDDGMFYCLECWQNYE
eukprot:314639_1